MPPTIVRGAVRCAFAIVLALASSATAAFAQGATTTATVRGVVTGENGPVSGATVVATNSETGVRRGAQTDEGGRYQIPFLEPGTYVIRAQRIGFTPIERPGRRLSIGQVEVMDFNLVSAAVQLAEQRITAEAGVPLMEPTKTGTDTRISEAQLRDLPTNGRNFKDLVVLAPGAMDRGNTGSGGGQSIGGGRTGASNILMDGVNNNESFFGGDARGGDRAPFSYSLAAVKEIQVITAGYDVERGQYTGGTVNAVTKSGTNKFSGALYGNLRGDEYGGFTFTKRDYVGRRPVNFEKQQYGISLGGPILKDRAHFFFSVDRHQEAEPRPTFVPGTDVASQRSAGISPDTLKSFLNVLRTVYGYNGSGEVGNFTANTDEHAFFGRLDWQINDNHKLTVRDNYTKVNLSADRLFLSSTSSDFLSNGGDNLDESNSAVLALNSVFGKFTNEFRAQVASEHKPRPSNNAGGFNTPLPQFIVRNVRSAFPDGTTGQTEIRFGADPVLHGNLLDQTTYELIENVRWARNNHTFKAGTNLLRVDVFNQFWNNSLGTFTYSSFDDFKLNRPSSFTRALPFTGRTSLPVADYQVYETALYAQDEWQATPRLFLTYGLRYDVASYPAKPAANPALETAFGLDVRRQPQDKDNFSPRFGFTYDLDGRGRTLVRGGTGVFYGRTPYVLWSNALLNTGRDQLSLDCPDTATAPVVNIPAFAANPANIPTSCRGTGRAPPAPQVNVFHPDYEQAGSWKSNLALDRLITEGWRVTVEASFNRITHNYTVVDRNLDARPEFTIEGGIPVYDPTPSTSNGATSITRTRQNPAFAQVYVHTSYGETKSFQQIFQVNGQPSWGNFYAAYTWDYTRDNASIPCCITGSMFQASRPGRESPNDYNAQWGRSEFAREHSIVVAPTVKLPYGFQVSGILRAFSGLPWTPRYNFDINGDGASNDRVFVPTELQLFQGNALTFTGTAAEQQAQRLLLERKIRGTPCLRENRGTIIERSACVNPWQKIFDAKLRKQVNTIAGQSLQIDLDFFNVLNGLNSRWGRRLDVSSSNEALLIPRGFDTATKRFRYEVNSQFGARTPASNFNTTQFQMMLGVQYNF